MKDRPSCGQRFPRPSICICVAVFVALWSTCPSVQACAAFGGYDKDGNPIIITGHPAPYIETEKAVIVWDEEHKTEHFIRLAEIATDASNVGFLVPTPQTPELVEVNSAIFDLTKNMAAPKTIPPKVGVSPIGMVLVTLFPPHPVFTTISSTLAYAGAADGSAVAPPVEVVHEQDIADYHAVVLAANDVTSLQKWLKDNGYTWNKDADAWLKPYLENHWKITAFKLLKTRPQGGHSSLTTRAIRMSFSTDRPFFPYSEPGDVASGGSARGPERLLSIAFLGTQRMKGALDDGHGWPGQIQFADTPKSPERLLALARLDNLGDQGSHPTFLSYFEDKSNPRPGTADLYFGPALDQSRIPQKITTDSGLPTDYYLDIHSVSSISQILLILLGIGGFLVAWYRRAIRSSS